MSERPGPATGEWEHLSGVEWVVAAICLMQPFRMLLAAFSPVDLHLGAVGFVLLVGLAAWKARRLPEGFPDTLDLAVLGFLLLALTEVVVLGDGPTVRSLKGLSVEVRFALLWLVGRALDLRAVFARWVLRAALFVGALGALVGVVEYHVRWGTLLELAGQSSDVRYWKGGMPRLYSFSMVPLSAAYLFVLTLCAAAWRSLCGRASVLPLLALLLIWQALPLTLSRSAVTISLGLTAAFAVLGGPRGRRFALLSGLAMVCAIAALSARGWAEPLAHYAEIGAQLEDSSAMAHSELLHGGLRLVAEQPLGYGFGEAGHLAMQTGGVFPWNETHYVTLALQMGVEGFLAFALIVGLVLRLWWREARHVDPDRRAIGLAGLGMALALSFGGLFHATWNMIVPQLYFWLLSAATDNRAARSQA